MTAEPFEAFQVPAGTLPAAVREAGPAGRGSEPCPAGGKGDSDQPDRPADADRPDPGSDTGLPLRTLEVTPAWVASLADRLLAARARLRERPAVEIAAVLARAGRRFSEDSDPVRALALDLLPASSGLSPEMAVAVLDGMAADWREERLLRMLDEELGGPAALDRFVPGASGETMAVGPALTVQVVAGSVPGVGVSALLRSLLVKSPTLLKPGRDDVVLPVLFARALRDEDAQLADALAVVYWPGGSADVEQAALARAEVVTAYGADETVRRLRALAPATARFVAYHHRVSVGVIGRDALDAVEVERTADALALAASMFDQRGCVSPRVVYAEEGGSISPRELASSLAGALGRLETRLPSAALAVGERSALQQERGTIELFAASASARGAAPDAPSILHGGAAPWTVVYEPASAAFLAGPGRFVSVRPVADASAVPELLAPLAAHLQTVGYAGLGGRTGEVARALGVAGATRVVPFREVPFPPPWWHHDGGGPLLDLVRWVDLARE